MTEMGPAPKHLIRFGLFEIDLQAEELRKSGKRMKLDGKPFQILVLLLNRSGEVVTREQIREKVWPDINREVDIEHSLNAAIKRLRDALGDSADNPRFIETKLGRGYRFIPVERSEQPAERVNAAVEASVAVLPFADISPGKDQEHFCDGMTEEIINALTKVDGLNVLSRTSVFQFKGRAEDVRKIGTELNVRTLVEGSVRKAGNKVRITVQLTNVTDGFHLLSQTYDRELEDVFAIQDEISQDIVNTLKDKLRWELKRDLGPRLVLTKPSYTENLEAYELCLKGHYYWNQKNEEGLKKSIDCFQAAIEKDARYAPACVGLANSYMALAAWQEDSGSRTHLYRISQALMEDYLQLLTTDVPDEIRVRLVEGDSTRL